MSDRPRNWGFRLSAIDILVIIGASLFFWFSYEELGDMAGIIPMVIGHFFLFCNVFRIHRTKELAWAALCIINVMGWAIAGTVWWPGIVALQIPFTVLFIIMEMRGPWYHGIFADRINSRLSDYLEKRL